MTWSLILGNDASLLRTFYGSFKDVRLWKAARSDAALYTFRFNQVDQSEDLVANFKFMNGNPDVFNSAELGKSRRVQYPGVGSGVSLRAQDRQNLVCPLDTFFNAHEQKCTRFPYSSDVSFVYRVTNSVQHGHQMLLSHVAYSSLFLRGAEWQPKVTTTWSVDDPEVAREYLRLPARNLQTFDPVYMGDGQEYTFRLEMLDKAGHNFF